MEQCGAMSSIEAEHRPTAQPRDAYRHFSTVATRWMDNDAYGHINNVVYYSYFDTAVNRYVIEAGWLDVQRGPVIGLVVETHCNFFAPLSFPQMVESGVRVARLGTSSVRAMRSACSAPARRSAPRPGTSSMSMSTGTRAARWRCRPN
jgi:acyl-CoA thioesterase FadM